MKRLSMFICVALLATSVVFVSCETEDPDPPTIKVWLDGVEKTTIEDIDANDNVKVRIEFYADGDLKRIELDVEGGNNYPGFPKERDFESNMRHIVEFDVSKPESGLDYALIVKVTDKKDQSANQRIVIKWKEGTTIYEPTPLGEAKTHTFAYHTSGHSTNNLSLAELGMVATWSTSPDIAFAFTGSFVTLSATEFNAIETKEALEEKFDDGTPATTLRVTVPSNEKMYFIVKNGDNYFLVETTERYRNTDGEPPANRVAISYRS